MSSRGNNEAEIFYNIIDEVDHQCWPQFMRRIGFQHRHEFSLSDENKYRMLHRWHTEMGADIAVSFPILKHAQKELYGNRLDLNIQQWMPEKKRNRETAVLFYAIISKYVDGDFWNRIVRENLGLPQSEIFRIEQDCAGNSEEVKFRQLEWWRRANELNDIDSITERLRSIGVTSSSSTLTVSRFQLVLRRTAQAIADKMDLPGIQLDRAIQAVTLQIFNNPGKFPESLDSDGQYHRRKDMFKVYENPKGNIKIEELFDFAAKNARSASKSLSNQHDINEYMLKQGNNILATGQAGIGKTTLTRMVTKLLLDKQLLSETEYIIYIKVRDIDFKHECNMLDFLETYGDFYMPNGEPFSQRDFAELDSASTAVIIFDGVDEANTDQLREDAPAYKNPNKQVYPSIILRNVMKGNILSRAKKLWTSRQRQAYDLHENVRPHTIVQILGLDENSQEELGKQICTEKWPAVKKYLHDHPDIHVICYVPVMCTIAMSSIHSSMISNDDEVQLNTMTDLLAYALDLYTRSAHIRGEEKELSKISTLAWDGFLTGKIIFEEEDFDKAEIKQDAFEAFLVTEVYKDTNFRLKLVDGDKRSSFSHLIWQEMFAAIRAVMFTKVGDLTSFLTKLTLARWEVVGKLMYGLCHHPTTRRLKKILRGHLREEIEANRNVLKAFAAQRMAVVKSLGDKDETSKLQTLVQVCTWVRESNSDDFVEAVKSDLPDVIDFVGDLMPTDIRCIMHVIPDGQAITIGIANPASFIEKSLLLLCSEITRKNLKVLKMNLEGNNLRKIDASEFSHCLGHVDHLSFLKCRITDSFLREVADAIARRESPMIHLDLSHNPISIKGSQHLSRCVHMINSLNIDSCDIDHVKFETVAQEIREMNHSISLHIGYTNINDRAATAFCRCLHNIDSMAFARCGILDRGFLQFTSAIQNLEKPMKEIILSTNISANNDLSKMSDDAKATEVAKCLGNVRRLKLNCWIKSTGAEILADALKRLKQPMELLDVSGNKFGDNGARALSSGLHNISELIMENCGITKVGFQFMNEAIKDINSQPKTKVVFGSVGGVTDVSLL